MKKILSVLFAAALFFTGCNELDGSDGEATLTLNKTSLSVSSALDGHEIGVLTANLEGSSQSLNWYSTDVNVVSVKASGSRAVLICEGHEGSAKVGVRTADSSLEAFCLVTVTLSKMPGDGVSELAVKDGSATAKGFTLTWTAPAISSKVLIEVYNAGEPDVYKTYTVPAADQSYTIANLKTNSEGKAYDVKAWGYHNGAKAGTESSVAGVTLLADKVAPGNVSLKEADCVKEDHKITLTWNEPVDDDYGFVDVSISPAVDFAGEALATSTQRLYKGVTSAAFTNLAADTEYTFTLKTADESGNIQGDANNTAATGITVAYKTAADTTAPDAVTGVAINVGRDSATLTWKDSVSVDAKEVYVYNGEDKVKTVPFGTKTATVAGLTAGEEYSFTIVTADYNGNETAAEAITATPVKPSAKNVAVDGEYHKAVVVSWTDTDSVEYNGSGNRVTYSYEVTLNGSGSPVLTVEQGKGVAVFDNLEVGDAYTGATVKCIPSDDPGAGLTASVDKSVTVKKYYVQIKNSWGGRTLVPFITESKEYVNCVIAQVSGVANSVEVMTYPYWIVRPAIDGTAGYFSLEAAGADFTASGLYCYFSNTKPEGSTNYDVDGTGWGSGDNPHCFYGPVSQIGGDMGNACFKFDEETGKDPLAGCSPLSTIKTSSGKYFWSGNSNPGLKATADKSNGDYNWCYKVITE